MFLDAGAAWDDDFRGVADGPNGRRLNDIRASYGVGVRFSVLPAKRVNVRLDLARSKDDDAIHLSVGEAF